MKRTAAPAGQRESTVMGIPAAIKALRKFTRSDPVVNDRETLEALEKELFNTSDRVTAVMLGAYVETALEKLLSSRVRDNLNSNEQSKLFGFEGVSMRNALEQAGRAILPYSPDAADVDLTRERPIP